MQQGRDGVEGGGGLDVRGALGRWPDADAVLGGSMSDELRDWDLWGPLLFSLLLSFLLARGAREEQAAGVFSGVFAMIWVGSAVVTLQIKLLGGSMYVYKHLIVSTCENHLLTSIFTAPSSSR